jgi:hypothetical protein
MSFLAHRLVVELNDSIAQETVYHGEHLMGIIQFYNEPMGKERHLISTEPVSTTAFQFMDYYAPGLVVLSITSSSSM